MTADTLVYALGGGFGHAMRGAELARRLEKSGRRVTLLASAESARFLSGVERLATALPEALASGRFQTLVVDTFPRGWRNELGAETLARFSRRILICRATRDPEFAASSRGYDLLLNPYPPSLDEWPVAPERSRYVGWLTRESPLDIVPRGRDLVLFDPRRLVPRSLLAGLQRFCARVARGLRVIDAPVRAPLQLDAAKFLCIGAGYNTVYELANLQADLRFVPLGRRWDDQAHRAALVGRSVRSLDEAMHWIAAPTRTTSYAVPFQAEVALS